MAKGVIFGVLGCITILPSLILTFERAIEKTHHKNITPKFDKLSAKITKKPGIFAVIFIVLLVPALFGYKMCIRDRLWTLQRRFLPSPMSPLTRAMSVSYTHLDVYKRQGIGYEDELTGKTTLNLGTLAFEDGTLTIRIDSRFPITANYYQAIEVINSTFEKEGFQINECSYWPPTYLPKNHFLIEALLKSYREVTGDDSEPVSGTSASYSKVMANIAAFGAHYPGEGISLSLIHISPSSRSFALIS